MFQRENFDRELAKLNEAQKLAVSSIEGPVMVLAGPGTGKTQILALRIANILLNTQMDPYNILALTFTDNGAKAMKERLFRFIGNAAYFVSIETFHGFANRIISEHPEVFADHKERKILDDLTRFRLLEGVFRKLPLEDLVFKNNKIGYLKDANALIQKLKQENIDPELFRELVELEAEKLQAALDSGELKEKALAYKKQKQFIARNRELALVYSEYEWELSRQSLFDFNDIINVTIAAFKSHPFLLDIYAERYQYILADEFQDTNGAQSEILNLLASKSDFPNLFVVGDDDQAIYRFQGANVENLRKFLELYPSTTKINLVENYRSSSKLLAVSGNLIDYNFSRIKETGFRLRGREKPDDKPVKLVIQDNVANELEQIKNRIWELNQAGVPYGEMAIIVRYNAEAMQIASLLGKQKIPYFNSASDDLLSSDFVKQIIIAIKSLNNPQDKILLIKALSLPWSGFSGEQFYRFLQKLKQADSDKDLFQIMTELDPENKFVANYYNLLKDCQLLKPSHLLKIWAQKFELFSYFEQSEIPLNLYTEFASFVGFAETLEEQGLRSISEFCDCLDDYLNHDLKVKPRTFGSGEDVVQILTAHKSKGLEFDYVFIPYFSENKWGKQRGSSRVKLIPLTESARVKADLELEGIEDERRLLYVAITRAKIECQLSYAKTYGHANQAKQYIISMFASELGDNFLERIEVPDSEAERIEILANELNLDSKPVHSSEEKIILKELLANFRLSVSALNAWYECKHRFFYRYLLGVPEAKELQLVSGTCMHEALEKYFRDYKFNASLGLNTLLNYLEVAVRKSRISESDQEHILRQGTKTFTNWYNENRDKFVAPLFVEYDFARDQLRLGDVRLTGKLDKVELIDAEKRQVRIVDYKNSKPKSDRAIRGMTTTDDGSVYRQLVFYKLLCQLDPKFQFEATEFAFDYLQPRDSGKFARVTISVPDSDVEALKEEIAVVYKEIMELNYPIKDMECNCKNGCSWR
jgi:DNA helicase-2/ATP-dependent DNA helicase PcrA